MKSKLWCLFAVSILIAAIACGCIEEGEQKGERAKMLDTQPTEILTRSNERQIFQGYLDQVNDPNNIQWIYCMSWDGHVIFKSAVMGKTISATKSSEPYDRFELEGTSYRTESEAARNLPGYIPGTPNLMNPSGMFGHDTPGVIWMDPQGNYYEWHEGPYLVSNVPLKLSEPVLSYSNVDMELYYKAQEIENKLRNNQTLNEDDKSWLMK